MTVKNNQLEVPYTPAEQTKLAGITPGAQPQPATASQAEAIAGTDNVKMMTPLRVAQAITAAGGGGGGGGTITTGANLGSGVGVYSAVAGTALQFKSLVAGSGVTLTPNSTQIIISASAGGLTNTDGLTEGSTNLYYTEARVSANSTVVAAAAKVSASGSINTHNDVAYSSPSTGQALLWNGTKWANGTISGGGGEANTASNLGAGTGLFASKSGVDLRFKSLVAGTNVTLSNDANTVTINASGGGSGYLTQYLSFNSGTTLIKATGSSADLSAITAVKDFSQSGISRLILNQPTTVTYQSIVVTFTAGETTGRSQVNVELPEPNGQSSVSNAIRPITFRLNASSGVAATGGTIAMSGTTVVLSQTGYTAAAEQRMVVQF